MPKKKILLTKEEQEILDHVENKHFSPSPSVEEDLLIAKKAAKNFLNKDKRINIRISSHDLLQLKLIATKEGLPYQTLISSILHKYAAGFPSNI